MATECCNTNQNIEPCEQMQLNADIIESLSKMVEALKQNQKVVSLLIAEVKPEIAHLVTEDL
tara:strand:+ start:4312 stop:4497 length:186 start_codon:yes stop_codon:yes gene_type:complete